jgi:hypothetical protein
MFRRVLFLVLAATMAASAQPLPRRAANLAALLAYPGFYHLRPVTVAGTLGRDGTGQLLLRDEVGTMRILFESSAPDGLVEIRGQYWDLGRMNADDPRLATYDLRRAFGVDPEGAWPRPGQVLGIVATAIDPAPIPPAATIRAIVLFPSRYLDQKVTVAGQFAGRNLLGDLPDAPANSRYDFVLRSADASVWVSNIRPRGRDFDLALDARIDTGRWLEVSGTVKAGRGLQWIDAEADSLHLTKAPDTPAPDEATVRVPAAPPPEVIFSTPVDDETDVEPATSVRIQFSRDIDAASVKGRIRATYVRPEASGPPGPGITGFSTQYQPANRVLEIRFEQPFEPFRRVQIELLEGISGTDDQLVSPWTLSFTTGGS